jgi:hypothetical protein
VSVWWIWTFLLQSVSQNTKLHFQGDLSYDFDWEFHSFTETSSLNKTAWVVHQKNNGTTSSDPNAKYQFSWKWLHQFSFNCNHLKRRRTKNNTAVIHRAYMRKNGRCFLHWLFLKQTMGSMDSHILQDNSLNLLR